MPEMQDRTIVESGTLTAVLAQLSLDARDPFAVAVGAAITKGLQFSYRDMKDLLEVSQSRDIIADLTSGYSTKKTALVKALAVDATGSCKSYRHSLMLSRIEFNIMVASAHSKGEISSNDYSWLVQQRLPSLRHIPKVLKHLSDPHPGVALNTLRAPPGSSKSEKAAFYGLTDKEYSDFHTLSRGRSTHIHGNNYGKSQVSPQVRVLPAKQSPPRSVDKRLSKAQTDALAAYAADPTS